MAPVETLTTGPTRHRRAVVAVVVTLVVLAALVPVLVWWVGRSGAQTPASSDDADVLLTNVQVDQNDDSYTITSVEAVTRGDDAFLRLRLMWSEDADDSSDLRKIPAFGADVLLHEPYAGLTASCGASGVTTAPAGSRNATVELPCSGLLVPDDVASVALHD